MAISLLLMFFGSIICAFHTGQLSAWSECDNRYNAHIRNLDTDGYGADLMQYFDNKGEHDYYLKNFLTFKPSGKLYSGSNESGGLLLEEAQRPFWVWQVF